MAWYHQYQYAEIMMGEYPALRGRALPIHRYEISFDGLHILRVEVEVPGGTTQWFRVPHDVILYKSGKDLITLPETRLSESKWQKLLRRWNLKRR